MSDDIKLQLNANELKPIIKAALKEYLEDMVQKLGWLSLKTIGTVAVAGLVYLALHFDGFK